MRALSLASAVLLAGCGGPVTPTADDVARDGVDRSSYTAPGGLRVSMLSRGPADGRRVIFVHGTPGSAVAWEHYIRSPLSGTEAVALDRPGFGQTMPLEAMVPLKAQAAAIAPLLVARDGKWPVLVGHSLGGPIVAQVAVDNPGRVGALLILGEWRLISALLPPTLRNANRELLGLKSELASLAPRIAGLRCRISIIHGTKDDLVPYANVAFLQAHLKGAAAVEVTTLKGQNHFIVWNEEPRVRAALAALLAAPSPAC
jgi:pimeloyl-ACP methyl ester carboxylesterase